MLRALVAAIPANERFGTLETDYELLTHLLPGRRNIVALQARIGQGEVVAGSRIGEVTVADLVPEALRQNLSRIVVGEVRGAEAGAMFEAMQSGACINNLCPCTAIVWAASDGRRPEKDRTDFHPRGKRP